MIYHFISVANSERKHSWGEYRPENHFTTTVLWEECCVCFNLGQNFVHQGENYFRSYVRNSSPTWSWRWCFDGTLSSLRVIWLECDQVTLQNTNDCSQRRWFVTVCWLRVPKAIVKKNNLTENCREGMKGLCDVETCLSSCLEMDFSVSTELFKCSCSQ